MVALVIAQSLEQAQPTDGLLKRHGISTVLCTDYLSLALERLDDDKNVEGRIAGFQISEFDRFIFLDFPKYTESPYDEWSGSDTSFAKAELDAALYALLTFCKRPVGNRGLLEYFSGYRPQDAYILHEFRRMGWRTSATKIDIRDIPSHGDGPQISINADRSPDVLGITSAYITPQYVCLLPIPGTMFDKAFDLESSIARTQAFLTERKLSNALVHFNFSLKEYHVEHIELCSATFPNSSPVFELAVLQSFWR